MAEKTNSDHTHNYDKGFDPKPKKPCRACTDFKSWMHVKQTENSQNSTNVKTVSPDRPVVLEPTHECPLDKDELGRNTWSFLHTMAAYFPEKPSIAQQSDMKSLINIFSKFYPCDHCAADLRDDLKDNPPNTSNQRHLSLWFCQLHNTVNKKLGKPEFNCELVDERWRDGWKDGSCD